MDATAIIWLCFVLMALLTIAGAVGIVSLVDENFQLKERNALLEAREEKHVRLVNDLTAHVQQATLTAQQATLTAHSAQRGWSRTAAPELWGTDILAAVPA